MEIILAIVVASAVIFFGALISMGNERQRKAIDDLREQIVLWAIQDLHLKKEKLVLNISIDDPIQWLNQIIEKTLKQKISIQLVDKYDGPQAIHCSTALYEKNFVFSPLAPKDLHILRRTKKDRFNSLNTHPLLQNRNFTEVHEISVLSYGPLFDAELSIVWKIITGTNAVNLQRLWLYIY